MYRPLYIFDTVVQQKFRRAAESEMVTLAQWAVTITPLSKACRSLVFPIL